MFTLTQPAIAPFPSAVPTRRIFSGVQPSGRLHLGNYFGAIRQHIAMQTTGECFFFIADYHALTTIHNPEELRANVGDVALAYLALGLDPQKTVFFRQSDVPEVTELAWLLGTVTNVGLLERAVSYKDKTEKGIDPSVGLFTYPVLMAADILAFRGEVIPVGKDQVQHIEMAREMAGRFNNVYGQLFPMPSALLTRESKVLGIDGQKMSKSYGNTIEIFSEGKDLERTVARIVTDSKTVADPKDPDTCTVFALFRLFATEAEQAETAVRYRAGGMGYGELKRELLRRIEEHFADARVRRRDLLAGGDVEDVLQFGARRARPVAQQTLARAREATGLGARSRSEHQAVIH